MTTSTPLSCSVEHCDKPVIARGWCRKHYGRWYIHGDVNYVQPKRVDRSLPVQGRMCSMCRQDLPLEAFNPNPQNKGGLHSSCRECHSQYGKAYREANKEHFRLQRIANRERNRDRNLQRQYGITLDDYNRIWAEQGEQCAICGNKSRRMHLDHCHATGVVRGILCIHCNVMLGQVQDNPSVLRKAIGYLEREMVDDNVSEVA